MSESKPQGVGIIGVGKYIPTKLISNEQVEAWTGVPAGSIVAKTGIVTRFIVEDDETTSGISAAAAREAIAMAQIAPEQIGLIVACKFIGDYIYPALACKVQDLVGAKNAGAFDVLANCTAFQVGLGIVADRMMNDPSIDYGLVVGTAIQSRFIQWSDPDVAIFLGDGAGAAVLGRVPPGFGILRNEIFSNPKVYESVRLRGGGSSFPLRAENINDGLQYYEMNGMEVWKQVVQYQPTVINRVLSKIGKTIEDVDFFIFHQANLRLIEYLMAKMKQPMSKTYTTVAEIGNTAEASLAITLCEAVKKGLIKRGDLVVISGVGAGFVFGASILRWY